MARVYHSNHDRAEIRVWRAARARLISDLISFRLVFYDFYHPQYLLIVACTTVDTIRIVSPLLVPFAIRGRSQRLQIRCKVDLFAYNAASSLFYLAVDRALTSL